MESGKRPPWQHRAIASVLPGRLETADQGRHPRLSRQAVSFSLDALRPLFCTGSPRIPIGSGSVAGKRRLDALSFPIQQQLYRYASKGCPFICSSGRGVGNLANGFSLYLPASWQRQLLGAPGYGGGSSRDPSDHGNRTVCIFLYASEEAAALTCRYRPVIRPVFLFQLINDVNLVTP